MSSYTYDAAVVGAGPNGLAAAVVLAERGFRVLVLEGSGAVGGGARTEEMTLPGFRHDVCSAFHPLGAASPLFGRLPLEKLGVRWITPEIPMAHPLGGGRAAALRQSLDAACAGLGRDGAAWRRSAGRIAEGWGALAPVLMKPLLERPFPPPALAAGLLPASVFVKRFRSGSARALFAGLAAHAMRPLRSPGTAAVGLVLGALAHVGGWPLAEGGSAAVSGALAACLESLGGEIRLGSPVRRPGDLPPGRVVLFDTHPAALVEVYGDRMPSSARRRIARRPPGAAAYKIDYALEGPIPWSAPECTRAGVVHVGGDYRETAAALRAVEAGAVPDRPFVLVGQQSLFDPTRAPPGKHTAWVYTHVPAGFGGPMKDRIERQIERFAPGFRDLVLASRVTDPRDFEAYNPNYRAGDISSGAYTVRRMLGRPGSFRNPYRTGIPGVYLCSAAAPPGPGVHGMCGAGAASAVIRDILGSP